MRPDKPSRWCPSSYRHPSLIVFKDSGEHAIQKQLDLSVFISQTTTIAFKLSVQREARLLMYCAVAEEEEIRSVEPACALLEVPLGEESRRKVESYKKARLRKGL